MPQGPEAVLEVANCVWAMYETEVKGLRRVIADIIVVRCVEHSGFEKLEELSSSIPGIAD